MSLARLGLGTVQLGQDYGISNRVGRPDEREAANILARAAEIGIGYLDTAPGYGSAEALIGKYLSGRSHPRIVTKTSPVPEATIEPRHGRELLDTLKNSLDLLRVGQVHGLLAHRPDDLAKPGCEHIVDAMMEARSRGLARRIGASIYTAQQLELVESRFAPELVQLPLNALDRRPIQSGLLRRLKAKDVEIHARSVFLQGLLLMEPSKLPGFFAPIKSNIFDLHRHWLQRGLDPLAGCLGFARQHGELDAIIVGVNSRAELEGIVEAWGEADSMGADLSSAPEIPAVYVDPSQWPKSVA